MCLFVWHITKEVKLASLFCLDVFLVEGVATGSRVLLRTKTPWFTLVMHGLITHVYLLSVEEQGDSTSTTHEGSLIKLLFRLMTEETHPASWFVCVCVKCACFYRNSSRRQFSATKQNIKAKQRNGQAKSTKHLFHVTRDTSQSQRIWTLAPGSLSQNSKLHFFSAFCSCSLVYARIIFGIMLQLQCNIKGNFDALWPLWKARAWSKWCDPRAKTSGVVTGSHCCRTLCQVWASLERRPSMSTCNHFKNDVI